MFDWLASALTAARGIRNDIKQYRQGIRQQGAEMLGLDPMLFGAPPNQPEQQVLTQPPMPQVELGTAPGYQYLNRPQMSVVDPRLEALRRAWLQRVFGG